jgi:hypothetical protein
MYNGNSYAVRMNPIAHPGTTWVQVMCTGAISSQCNAWTVTPVPLQNGGALNPTTRQLSALGELIRISTTHGKTVETSLGIYYIALSVTVTK